MRDRQLFLVDAAVPALVAAVVLVGLALQASSRPVPIALGLGAATALLARRRWPGWTLLGSGALVAALIHVDRTAASVAVLAPAVALYSVALRRGRGYQAVAAVVAVAAVIAADLLHPGELTLGQTLAHAMLVALPLLAAEVIRTHRANIRLLVERHDLDRQAHEQDAERRAEQERMRIARELHDVVAHTLTEINVTAAAAAERTAAGDARAALEQIEHTSHGAIAELRGLLGVLRGPDAEPPHAPVPGIGDIGDLVDRVRDGGLPVGLDVDGTPPDRISDATSLATYRIVQESLTNVRRHAPGAPAAVTLRFGPTHLTLTVRNGPGRPARADAAASAGRGVGITGMRERASAVGGRLVVGRSAGGFRVCAELPYEVAG